MPKQTELDPYEKAVEADSAGYVPIAGEKRQRIKAIVAVARRRTSICGSVDTRIAAITGLMYISF